jgi:hypothetical protein
MFDDLLATGRRINAEVQAGRSPDQPGGESAHLSSIHWYMSPLGGVRIENFSELFTERCCDACLIPFGERTRRRMRVRYEDPQSRRYNGVLAQLAEWPKGPTFHLFSDRFLRLLQPAERRRLSLRMVTVSNPTKITPRLFEIVKSATHLPLVALRGGNPDRPHCEGCERQGPPWYSLVGSLPVWLNPTGILARGDQPELFIAAGDFPNAVPPWFTIGDWRWGAHLAVSSDRMWPAHKPPAAASGIRADRLGVVAPALIETTE